MRKDFSQRLRGMLRNGIDEELFGAVLQEANASMDRSIAHLDDAIAFCNHTMERIEKIERRQNSKKAYSL